MDNDEILIEERWTAGDIARLVKDHWETAHPGQELPDRMLERLVPELADDLAKEIVSAADQFVNDIGAHIDEILEDFKVRDRKVPRP